jgi:hypothetical protein
MDLKAISEALKPTRDGLEAAGFSLELAERNEQLVLTVVGGESACEDCLVPKSLFKQMAKDEISEAGLSATDLQILYPLDLRKSQH